MEAEQQQSHQSQDNRNKTIIKQKQVSELLKELADSEYAIDSQVFLPEETSWRIQNIKSLTGNYTRCHRSAGDGDRFFFMDIMMMMSNGIFKQYPYLLRQNSLILNVTQTLITDIFCYEKEISDYKESLYNKDHKNFCGSDPDGNPVVISVMACTGTKETQIILRDVRQTRKEIFANVEDGSELDAERVLNLAKIVSPELEIEKLEEIECDDIKVGRRNIFHIH